MESILNATLEGEIDAHLTEEERQTGTAVMVKCPNKPKLH